MALRNEDFAEQASKPCILEGSDSCDHCNIRPCPNTIDTKKGGYNNEGRFGD